VTAGKKPAVPCGACRQIMAEFNPGMKIIAATVDGKVQEFDLAELLPFPSQGILEGSRDV
jgi:cytidine deaminase